MNRISRYLIVLSGVVLVSLSASEVSAHGQFKTALGKKYTGVKISCNVCHVKKKPKNIRNDFGKLFDKQFKAAKLSITKDLKAAKAKDKANNDRGRTEQKSFEKKIMIPEFEKALKKIKDMKEKKSGKKYDELIKSAELPEVKLKDKK